MTSLQYKNVIIETLNDIKNVEDSINVVRKIFDNCNTGFPYGTYDGIMLALSSDDFICWRSYSSDGVQKHANMGIPSVGINSKCLFVIEPEDNAVLGSADDELSLNMDYKNLYVRKINSISFEELSNMQFFAFTLDVDETN